jgi:hypothetical protein
MIYDMIWYMIWYDMIWYDMMWYVIYDMIYNMIYVMIYVMLLCYDMIRYDVVYLTAIGLPPDGSRTVHIYTQTIHRTTQSMELESSFAV